MKTAPRYHKNKRGSGTLGLGLG